jgi:hypothetical protein
VHPGIRRSVNSCGRSDSSTGVEGYLDLYDGTTRICTLHWNNPQGSSANEFEVLNYDSSASDYSVIVGNWNSGHGPLGNVDIVVTLLV